MRIERTMKGTVLMIIKIAYVILLFVISTFCFYCSDKSTSQEETDPGKSEITDVDGIVYKTILIGEQWWMAENLKVKRYLNGDIIQNITEDSIWFNHNTGAWCYYQNNDWESYTYGILYNWYTTIDERGLAPEGWHVPTDDDWKVLELYLGMSAEDLDKWDTRGSDVGGKLKGTSRWRSPNIGATDSSGFNALPGGMRMGNGPFVTKGYLGVFWSSTEWDNTHAIYRLLDNNNSEIRRERDYKQYGFSIRCVRN